MLWRRIRLWEKICLSKNKYFPNELCLLWLMMQRFSLSFSLFYFHIECCIKETKNQPQQQSQTPPQRAVSFLVSKTISSVLKSSRKIIFRVCEAANVKKQFKMFQMYSSMQRRQNSDNSDQKEPETTGHDRFYQERSRYRETWDFFFFFFFSPLFIVLNTKKCQSSDVNIVVRESAADKVLMFTNISSRWKAFFPVEDEKHAKAHNIRYSFLLCWFMLCNFPPCPPHRKPERKQLH